MTVGKDDWYRGELEILPDAEPAQIDLRIEDCRCDYKGQASQAIFRVEGEEILLAAPRPGSPRPTVFDQNSGQLVRLKPIAD